MSAPLGVIDEANFSMGISFFPAKASVTHGLDFASLLQHTRRTQAKARANYTSKSDLAACFTSKLAAVQVVSFDIFDTALVRFVDHPADVFLHLEQHPAFAGLGLRQPASVLRVAAEKAARSLVFQQIGSYEVNLLEIYQVFCDLNGIPQDYVQSLVTAEEEIELRLCTPCEPIFALYLEAVAAGKLVIFVSDTYHGTEFLLRLLRNNGYVLEDSSLFASSEARKAKQSGELFPLVLARLGVKASDLLHVGDNPVADHKQPLSQGIEVILHSHKACGETASLFLDGLRVAGGDSKLRQISEVRGMQRLSWQAAARSGFDGDFWWRFGYSSVGPLTVGFCQWLENRFRADGMDQAYFLLRDGALMHAVYQALFKGVPEACPASTLPTSRRAMVLPVFELAPDFALPNLMAGIGLRPMREYIERLGLSAEKYRAEALEAGFESMDECIDARLSAERLITFFFSRPVLLDLLNRGRAERESLLAYLKKKGVASHAKVALVDLGWAGTIHQCLHVLLKSVASPTHLTGYYMATFAAADHAITDVSVASYLAHKGQPAAVCAQIRSFLNLFETVYTSAEGSLLYFEGTSRKNVEAVRQASDKSADQTRNLHKMHQGALAFAEDFRHRNPDWKSSPLPPELASEGVFRVINQPTIEEAQFLGGLVHCDNFGSSSTHVSASLNAISDPTQLVESFKKVHWKQGCLALPTVEAAALRTLLWLSEREL
jgi:predicted HAD superfamily hydrolase